ncbi:hypothetical protein BUE80_DR004977, partial [Diplocarpon rosae]
PDKPAHPAHSHLSWTPSAVVQRSADLPAFVLPSAVLIPRLIKVTPAVEARKVKG